MAHRQSQNYVYKDNPDPKYCKKCRYCKQLIDKKATVCPFCKRNQPLIPPLVCILILLMIGGLFVYFYEPNAKSDTSESTSTVEITTEQ